MFSNQINETNYYEKFQTDWFHLSEKSIYLKIGGFNRQYRCVVITLDGKIEIIVYFWQII